MNPVLKTTLFVVKNSKKVKINKEKISDFVKKIINQQIKTPFWPKNYHLISNDVNEILTYLVIY